MIFRVYAMRDSLTGFANPTFEVNDAVALRNFEAAILSSPRSSLFHHSPEDFTLHFLGTFDSDSGELVHFPVTQIASGSAIILNSVRGKESADV
ncbi:nonstructural protein [Sigmofec virus UA08Rod_5667]|uniref:Nonstructural protein n=1 Tax=Sigmofec virus UA08Rod_5667 TaxID=2929435 RepID=A0A976N166_9VIRU|nr:nonstructural protein [Sigmofec virus UA08Rod_5667]